MLHVLEESNSVTLSINQRKPPSQGVVLRRRHFQHAVLSGCKNAKRMGSDDVTENPATSRLPLMSNIGPSFNSEEWTSHIYPQPFRLPRKYRMRDQHGCLFKKNLMARAPCLPASYVEGCSKLTLNVRSLKLGTVNMIFRGPATFSVDYIEIGNKVRIAALELTSCEWCRGGTLPAVFLQMTDAALWRLREQLAVSTDMVTRDGCQKQQEKYLVIILESVPTVLEEATLEEIFSEIGRLRNLSNFLVTLTCEQATGRLMAHKHSQKELCSVHVSSSNVQSEVTTLRVSDNEDDDDDDDDLIECPSSHTQLAKTLVIYPPPPAKGGFSITKEDLSCLDEGEYLNDVIMDFYLKYLVCEKIQEEDANRCHVFSSFFYKSLTQNELEEDTDSTGLSIQERRHNRVKTWTRHLDLFKKDFIFVPINQSFHWYLAVICFPGQASHCPFMDPCENNEENWIGFTPSSPVSNPMSIFYRHPTSEQVSEWSTCEGEMDEGFCLISDDDLDDELKYNGASRDAFKISDTTSKQPCVLIMDSLGCGAKPAVVKVLQEYLEMEWRVRKGSLRNFDKRAMNGWSVQVPQQNNHTDCGVYVLQYVESFMTNPPKTFHPDMDLSDWFPQRLVKQKRERIKRIILRLHHQQRAELGK